MATFKPAVLFSALLLAACGGGGGGGSNDAPPETTPPVQTDNGNSDNSNGGGDTPAVDNNASPPASQATLGKISGYTYTTPDGREYKLRRDDIYVSGQWTERLESGQDGSEISSTSWCCGKMSYTTYGTWSSKKTGEHDVFYTGEATLASNVPTQGSATYVGSGMRAAERSDASFNVDFAAKTIKGDIAASSAFGSAVAMQGKIVDGGFRGDAHTGDASGSFVGHFNGPAAEELGGVATFADSSKNASFGATRQ